MHQLESSGFDWDEGNRAKCQRHGVSVHEIETMLSGFPRIAPDLKHLQTEPRFLAVGRSTQGRPMFVVFTLRDPFIRPLSARYMHVKEAKRYEESPGV